MVNNPRALCCNLPLDEKTSLNYTVVRCEGVITFDLEIYCWW